VVWHFRDARTTQNLSRQGIEIVMLSNDALEAVATRADLVQLLWRLYERVRLDPSGARDAGY